jgi:hypothetical protein
VNAAYPATPPSNSTVTVAAPSSHDAPYTRQITIGLSSTGNQRFEYGWSTSSTTAPNTAYLQTSTDLTNRKGTLNYLGKYSGTGTTWNGGTLPDQDWYLWVRSVKTTGVANAWGTPLKVHTPKTPIWVGVGDSYSSGHHQDTNEPYCPNAADAPLYPGNPVCGINGAPHVLPNDPTFSWVTRAVAAYNSDSSLHIPAAWRMSARVIAVSGMATSSFGPSGTTPGTTAWASSGQAGQLSVLLYASTSSWNVMSFSGGANDTPWADMLKNWYINHFTASYAPWSVPDGDTSNCPDTEAIYQSLLSTDPISGQTFDNIIRANLGGLVTVANRASSGVRIINAGYPYVVNSDSPCSANWTSNGSLHHGVVAVIDRLNADHTAITGPNVKYLDLSGLFGSFNPLPYIQQTSLYGYPHANASGQTVEGNQAELLLKSGGWN